MEAIIRNGIVLATLQMFTVSANNIFPVRKHRLPAYHPYQFSASPPGVHRLTPVYRGLDTDDDFVAGREGFDEFPADGDGGESGWGVEGIEDCHINFSISFPSHSK